MAKQRVLVVGLGSMGMSHALAYTRIPGYEVVGLCTRHIDQVKLPEALAGIKTFTNYEEALAELKPDVVSVNTLPDTHADYAIKAMEAGAHVFVEKPLADSVANAEKVVEDGAADRQEAGGRLHPPPASVVEQVHRDRPPARHAAGLPDEPQPAIERRDLGLAQAADGLLAADRRLRRPLCRRHVPDDQGQAGPGPCDGCAPHRRGAGLQLRHASGRLRRRLGRLVRGRLGADDERDRLLREGRDRAEGLGLDRHGRGRRRA